MHNRTGNDQNHNASSEFYCTRSKVGHRIRTDRRTPVLQQNLVLMENGSFSLFTPAVFMYFYEAVTLCPVVIYVKNQTAASVKPAEVENTRLYTFEDQSLI